MSLVRNIPLEREWTAAAAEDVGAAADRLNDFADSRARPGPVDISNGRDLEREAAEELADARNYLCWSIAQLEAIGHDSIRGHTRRRRLRRVLALTALAFDELDHLGLDLEVAA